MNKLILSIFSSLMIFIVIWCFVLYARYGNDWVQYHIDLINVFSKFNFSEDFADVYRSFNNSVSNFESSYYSFALYCDNVILDLRKSKITLSQ